jgi:HEPN domain-containing protein
MRPEEAALLRQWVARSDDDLRMAQLALNSIPPVAWGAAFHAQQAVEKLLKALLTFHKVEFEKVHSIDYLFDLLEAVEPGTGALRPAATGLTDYAVGARYPLPRHDPTESDAREAIEIAKEVRAFVLERLPS